MYVYLVADADAEYSKSAYCFRVGNFEPQVDSHLGWTVVEAYLHGILAATNFIILKGIYKHVTGFIVCTASKQVIKVIQTDYLEQIKQNNWKSPDKKPIFYLPLLKELYFHRIFYKERNIDWTVLSEVGEMEYREFENCMDKVHEYLGG